MSMKSCIMAGWLLTVSVGNAIVVIFAEARLTDNMVGSMIYGRFKLLRVVSVTLALASFPPNAVDSRVVFETVEAVSKRI